MKKIKHWIREIKLFLIYCSEQQERNSEKEYIIGKILDKYN